MHHALNVPRPINRIQFDLEVLLGQFDNAHISKRREQKRALSEF